MTLRERIAYALKESGLSQAQLARAIGISPVSVNNWATGETKTLKGGSAIKAAAVLGVSPLWLSEGIGPIAPADQHPAGEHDKSALANSVVRDKHHHYAVGKIISNAQAGPGALRALRLVPVVGRAKGGDHGYMVEEEYPVGHGNGTLAVPTRDTGAFGLRIEGDSMEPVFPHGSYACVEPKECYEPGDDVYVALKDGRKLIKRLAWMRGDAVRLDSYNIHHQGITVAIDEIDAMYPAMRVPKRHFLPD